MSIDNSSYIWPLRNDQKIWRYMDFTKYVDTLITSSLFFCRIDKLEDIFEGSLPVDSRKERDQLLKYFKRKKDKSFLELESKFVKNAQMKFAVNCWHINNNESAAMWKLYLKSNEGIAIQSTLDRLKNCFHDKKMSVSIKKVDYYDYETERLDNFQLLYAQERFFAKRKSFEHERELRCLIKDVDLEQGGTKVKIDIKTLIKNIYVSPDSPVWLTTLIKKITAKFEIKAKVINSRLNGNPIF